VVSFFLRANAPDADLRVWCAVSCRGPADNLITIKYSTGELFGLRVKHIDFTHRMVKVEQQIQRVPGGKGVHVCPPKTRRSHRRVPLPGIIATSLKEHLDNFPAHGESFLFRNEKGEPIHSSRFYEQIWRPAIAKASSPKEPDPTPYGMPTHLC
jgi:integrase